MDTDATTVAAPYPKPSLAWYVTGVLTLAWILSYLDRMIITLLTPALKLDLALSDTQISLVQGIGFSVVFVLAGLPLGRMVDRTNRRNIIIAGLLLWCLMTLGCGLASTYWQLLLARMGVGIGEACLAPASFSILADYMAPQRRGKAIGLLSSGASVGTAGSNILGGLLLKSLEGTNHVTLPLLGEIASWRFVFIVFALPGLLVAVLLATVREPVRRERMTGPATSFTPYLRQNLGVFAPLFVAFGLNAMITLAFSIWGAMVFVRLHGMTPGNVGLMLGAMQLAISAGGGVLGGHLSDVMLGRFAQSGRFRALLLVTPLMAVAAILLALSDGSLAGAAVACGAVMLCYAMGSAGFYSTLQGLTPNKMRGQVIAVNALVINLIGMGLGPTLVAVVTDHIFHDEQKVGLSLALVALPSAILAWLLIFLAMRRSRGLGQILQTETDG